MELQQFIIDGYIEVLRILENSLDGLTEHDLNWKPRPDCNSMGWLVWHLARELDYNIAELMGEEQIWTRDGWYSRFNREPKPLDTGFHKFGHTMEDVAAFRSPNVKTLLEYYRAVLEQTQGYINNFSVADLNRELEHTWDFERQRHVKIATTQVRLMSVLSECLQHAGQVAYIRGLLKGIE